MFIEKVSPLDISVAVAGEAIADSIVVMTTDLYGNPTGGESVYFVTANRCVVGTDSTAVRPFDTDSAFTSGDENGRAAAQWTLSVNGAPTFQQLTAYFKRYDDVLDETFSDTVNFLAQAQVPASMEYYYGIRTIFEDNCFQCHGPGADTSYRLDYYYQVLRDGNMVPGDTNSPILADSDPNNHFGNANMVEEDKIIRWVVTDNGAPGSSGLNNYNDHIKGIVDAGCISCHGDVTPDGDYSMTSHSAIRGAGTDAISNAIPGDGASLVVQYMNQRHNWNSLDPDSVTAATLADSISSWIVNDYLRQY
jgi:mono/diheme cytochrome c family protein